MSVVTGVVLVTSLGDEECRSQVNAWLEARDFGPLVDTSDNAGGTKHPECTVLCAGYNYFGVTPMNAMDFTVADFAAFVVGLPWEQGESVVLVINPPHLFPVRVFRVPDAQWSHQW